MNSVGQSLVLITPRSWVQSPYGPFTQDLDLMVLQSPFQLRLVCSCDCFPKSLNNSQREEIRPCHREMAEQSTFHVRLVMSKSREHTCKETDSRRKKGQVHLTDLNLESCVEDKSFLWTFLCLTGKALCRQWQHSCEAGYAICGLQTGNENKIDCIPNWQKHLFVSLTRKTPDFSDNLLLLETLVHCAFKIEISRLL